jgi:hypothetical protein
VELKLGRIQITKFKSQNRSYFILLKISLIGYLLIVLAGYVTSNTAAYYRDYQRIDGSITIGTWESEEEGQQEQQQPSDETDRIEDGINSEQNLESKQSNEPLEKSNEAVENDVGIKMVD